jgi:plastocyanin
MSRKSVWTAGFAVPMMIAVALLSPGLPMVKANAQKASAKSAEVKIDNFSFALGTLTVAVGTTVTWTNPNDIPHTVVSTNDVFKSKVRDTDDSFLIRLPRPLTTLTSARSPMTGTVVVQ